MKKEGGVETTPVKAVNAYTLFRYYTKGNLRNNLALNQPNLLKIFFKNERVSRHKPLLSLD